LEPLHCPSCAFTAECPGSADDAIIVCPGCGRCLRVSTAWGDLSPSDRDPARNPPHSTPRPPESRLARANRILGVVLSVLMGGCMVILAVPAVGRLLDPYLLAACLVGGAGVLLIEGAGILRRGRAARPVLVPLRRKLPGDPELLETPRTVHHDPVGTFAATMTSGVVATVIGALAAVALARGVW
jgi:hypothetical protein